MKKIIIALFISLFIVSCLGGTGEQIVKPDQDMDDPKLTCMQQVLVDHQIFQQDFVYKHETPELTVFAKGKYATLSDEDKDAVLESIGRQWQSCYPDDFRPMTLWLKDINDMIITVIFVTKE